MIENEGTVPSRTDQDPTVQYMEKSGIPLTVENWIEVQYAGMGEDVPDEIPAELMAMAIDALREADE